MDIVERLLKLIPDYAHVGMTDDEKTIEEAATEIVRLRREFRKYAAQHRERINQMNIK